MAAELKRETGPAHPLAAQQATPVAKCSHCDDVVFELSAGGFAFVHLTWSRHLEAPPWPAFEHIKNGAGALARMQAHAT